MSLKDLAEISDEVKSAVNFVSVSKFDEVIPYALVKNPANDLASNITYNTEITAATGTQGALI